jgi:outer membrane protein OmpA-like peptidoglycan-associated protein
MLPHELQARFGQALGHDFSEVRVHRGQLDGAAGLAQGDDVALAQDRADPESPEGRQLIGHELAHVVQQSRGGASPDAEARAWSASVRALRGEIVSASDLGGAPAMVAQHGDPSEAPAAGPAVRSSGTGLDHFTTDSAVLTKAHRASIDQLAWSVGLHLGMLRAGKASIRIVGHTDTTGTEKHNTGLGQQRAESVRAELAEALKRHAVRESQVDPLATASAGEADLAVPTGDNVGEPRNRRVHIEVTITAPVPAAQKPPVDLNLPPGWVPPTAPEGTPLPKAPPAAPATPSRSWLEDALKRDQLLKQLPGWAREKAIDGLKDMDETVVDKVIDAVPWDDTQKAAAKAALKALLKTLKGQKFEMPKPPPRGAEFGPEPEFPKAPGEKIFKLPPIRFDWP